MPGSFECNNFTSENGLVVCGGCSNGGGSRGFVLQRELIILQQAH